MAWHNLAVALQDAGFVDAARRAWASARETYSAPGDDEDAARCQAQLEALGAARTSAPADLA